MNKIWLIIQREYLVRVRKKSFIIMTILAPILIAALMIVPIYLAHETQEERIIAINQQEKLEIFTKKSTMIFDITGKYKDMFSDKKIKYWSL